MPYLGNVLTSFNVGTDNINNDAVTTAKIADGAILNADVNAAAAIAGTKISPDFGSQNILTTGSATAASLIPTSSTVPTDGVYLPAANSVAISTNGTGRLFVDSSGNVGLGTNSPASIFHVNQNVSSGNYQSRITLENSDQRTVIGSYWQAGIGQYSIIQSTNEAESVSGALLLNPSGGNVGVGTTSPGALLSLAASNTATANYYDSPRVTIQNTSATSNNFAGIAFSTASGNDAAAIWSVIGSHTTGAATGSLVFGTTNSAGASTERARIDSSGRLLVGTSSSRTNSNVESAVQIEGTSAPPSCFSLVRNSNDQGRPFILFGKTRSTSNGGSAAVQDGDFLGSIIFAGANGTDLSNQAAQIDCAVDGESFTSGDTTDLPGRLVFSTTAHGASSPTERMRIDRDGSLLVGHTSQSAPNPSGCSLFPNGVAHIGNNAGASGWGFINFYRSTTFLGNISQNGTTQVSYNISSDYRLKENVTPVNDGITRLQQLKPSRFNFIADPTKTVDGFLAHEAQAVVPECVTGEKDAVDDDGNPIYQGIDQSKLVPLLTAALQEAIGEIESLKARVAALESA